MDIGQFNKRITIIEEVNSYDNSGFENIQQNNYITLWAYVNNLKGREFWDAKQVGYENTLEIMVRYNPKLDKLNSKTFYIKYKNILYDIIQIDNVKHSNEFVKFKVIERG